MKGAIFFEGRYGATRQYAAWLSGDLQLPVFDVGRQVSENPGHFDFLLIGSPVYYGKLKIEKWLRRNLPVICNKKLFLFIVTATPAQEYEEREKIIRASVPEVIRHNCEIYFLPGRLIHGKLSWKHRMILKFVARASKDPAKRARFEVDFDEVKRENLTRMINAVRSYHLRGFIPVNGHPPAHATP